MGPMNVKGGLTMPCLSDQKERTDRHSTILKVQCLLILCVHTSLSTIVMHRSRQELANKGSIYAPSTAVLLGEVLKLFVCAILCLQEDGLKPTSITSWTRIVYRIKQIRWQMAVPSIFYVVQNTLQLVAGTHLTPVAYQTASQFKLFTAAMISTWILHKHLKLNQWTGILVLLAGILTITVERPHSMPMFQLHMANGKGPFTRLVASSPKADTFPFVAGILTVILSCFFGSFAGVYLEKQIKFQSATASLWQINLQLSIFGIMTSSLGAVWHCYTTQVLNPLHDFGTWAWLAVVIRSLGGLIVALVLKYADSILKGFATSFAIVLTLLIEVVLNGRCVSSTEGTGVLLVCISSIIYSF